MPNEFIVKNGLISQGNVIVTGSLTTSGSLTTTGTITATTLVVQTITSSISSITGSTNFGSLVTDTHVFTGSLNVTGAFYVTTGSVGIGTVSPSQLFEVVGGEIKAGRVDSSNEGGQLSFGRSTDNATAWYIDAYGNVASPQLRFVNVTNAVVAMTITGSNVGIGTSTPTGRLDVASRGITKGSMPAGSVIQVVSYQLVTSFSTTSASDQDTGLKVSITPTSSTSKILVLVSANARATNSGGNCYVNMKLIRGTYDTGVALHNGFAVMGNFGSTDIRGSVSYSYLDSPATTSSTQYVVSMNSQYAATVYMDSTTSPSTITLMEIAQ
jgi:hypothetical protein